MTFFGKIFQGIKKVAVGSANFVGGLGIPLVSDVAKVSASLWGSVGNKKSSTQSSPAQPIGGLQNEVTKLGVTNNTSVGALAVAPSVKSTSVGTTTEKKSSVWLWVVAGVAGFFGINELIFK